MKLEILTIGAAAIGLLAMAEPTRAMPVASLAPAASAASDIASAHYSRYRHVHRDGQVYYRSDRGRYAAGERASSGRSVSKLHGSKYKSMNQYAPERGQGARKGRSVDVPRGDAAPSGAGQGRSTTDKGMQKSAPKGMEKPAQGSPKGGSY